MELHYGKLIVFEKRERKAEVLSELFEVERIIVQRAKSRKVIICLIYWKIGQASFFFFINFSEKCCKNLRISSKL
jgi:hypothetical protein